MKLIDCKKQVIDIFKKSNIDEQEVNILFCEALNCLKTDLLTKTELTNKQYEKIKSAVKKRLKGMPIQKIFGRAYFYGYTFKVNKNVLCPRPETELLVEESLKFVKDNNNVLDLCTGSGAIALSIAKNSNAKVFASDISKKALKVAKFNAKNLNSNVSFIKSNMFNSITQKFEIIVSNPPYIKSEDIQNLDAEVKKYDPVISLDGGHDGLDFYTIIANQSKKYLNKNGVVLVEVGFDQAQDVKNIFEQNGFACYIKKDYNNIERIVVGELKW